MSDLQAIKDRQLTEIKIGDKVLPKTNALGSQDMTDILDLIAMVEAKDQRIAELEAELQKAWNACDAAEVKSRHVEAVLNQLKSAIAASEDTRKEASSEVLYGAYDEGET